MQMCSISFGCLINRPTEKEIKEMQRQAGNWQVVTILDMFLCEKPNLSVFPDFKYLTNML